MSENFSIDEIIRQAEEIRKKTLKTAQSAMKDIDSSAREITAREIEVPQVDPENIIIEPKSATEKPPLQKTAVIDSEKLKTAEIKDNSKTRVVDQKTRAVNLDDKTG
ncbi:MAG: hypothetical protein K2J35_02780, partial [Eubacterium sp.]|nr:hypothetical protein [Eubacterium sp.]